MNVTKLCSDNADPREYLTRLADCESCAQQFRRQWRVINDLEQLEWLFQS
jgi:hypothetical protein